jgi:hypothetical protein
LSAKQAVSTALLPLFTMEVLHQYLSGGAYAAFALKPLGDTEKILQRLGWAGEQRENTFTLYAERAAAMLEQDAVTPDLCYAMKFHDPDFARYTDLSPLSESMLSFTGMSNQPHASFMKFDSSLKTHSPAVISFSVKQLLSDLQSHSVHSNPPQRESEGDVPRARLTFPSRYTIWRYDFFNHGGAAAKDYAVVPAVPASTGAHLEFKLVAGLMGPDGETSLAFESSRAIPLAAAPRERFMLLLNNKKLIADLPTPGLDFIRAGEDCTPRSCQIIYL